MEDSASAEPSAAADLARGHIDDFNFEEALGLFAGLNVLPKKSFASDYSYRTQRQQQQLRLAG